MLKNNRTESDYAAGVSTSKIWHDWFCWLIVIAVLLLGRPANLGSEGVQNFSYIHSLYFDGDLDFENQYRLFLEKTRWYSNQDLISDPATGLPLNRQSIGPSIMWSPFLLPVFAVQQVLSESGGTVFLSSYAFAISLATSVYCAVGLLLLYRMFCRIAMPAAARFAIVIVWLASPLFYYLHFAAGFEHTLTFSLMVVLLTFATASARMPAAMLLYGFCTGLFLIFRNGHLVVVLALLGFEGFRWFRHRETPVLQYIASASAFTAGFAIPMTFQAVTWKILHSSFWYPSVTEIASNAYFLFEPNHLLEVLISPHHGLFYWHPLLIIGLAGLLVPGGRLSIKSLAITLIIANWWWTGSSTQWWAGVSFGQRFFCAVLPAFAIGAVYLYSTFQRFSPVLWSVLVLGSFWNTYLTFAYDQQWISQRDPVSWSKMIDAVGKPARDVPPSD